ncbi:MAG: hypothetical protein J5679_03105 [Alphaproteobacteria bacterium]|nr:hypothetical protein [Alphaproteobacteria bacterium]
MNTETIVRLLQNSGINVLGADSSSVYIEDPSCILRSFETFIEYAWIIITAVTGVLLFGWAVSMIRGAQNDLITNLRNLLIMFATLSCVIPIVNMIWGDNLFAIGCETITVSLGDLNTLLDARNAKLKNASGDLYEDLDIYDSGVKVSVTE